MLSEVQGSTYVANLNEKIEDQLVNYSEVKGKLALVTGASSGIGKELARLHASHGGDLLIVARRVDELEALKSELEEAYAVSVSVIAQDLSAPGAAAAVFAESENRELQVDYLINNAGFGGHGKFHERDTAADQSMIQVNINALTELMHAFLPGMVARGSGRVLNVSSTASMMPGPLQAVYYATKAYVTSLSQAVAEELSDTNVTVTALCPGFVATGFIEASNIEGVAALKDKNAAKSPVQVAQCGYDGMLRGELVTFNDSSLKFMLNWVTPMLPRKRLLKMSRQFMEK